MTCLFDADDEAGGAESAGMAAARSAVAIQKPKRSTAMHAHGDGVTSMRTADSNPFIVRPNPRVPAPADPSTSCSARRSYSPPRPIPSSHSSRTPSPNVTHTASSLGLSFRLLGSDEEDGENTQMCMRDASFASSATFRTCSHTGDHDDEHPPPPDSQTADVSSRRRSLEPSVIPSSSPRPSLDPSTSTSRPRVEAFEAAHPPRARPSWSGSALESLYPPGSALGSPYAPSTRSRGRGRNPAQHTLALMAERARLLGELASIRAGRTR